MQQVRAGGAPTAVYARVRGSTVCTFTSGYSSRSETVEHSCAGGRKREATGFRHREAARYANRGGSDANGLAGDDSGLCASGTDSRRGGRNVQRCVLAGGRFV